MSKTKRHKSIYTFLESSGVLESNDPELIKKARQAYWRSYHKEYKRIQRGKLQEHIVFLNKEEDLLINGEASKHDMTVSQFLKQSVIAYIHKQYIPLPNESFQKIEIELSHIRTLLDSYSENSSVTTKAVNVLQGIEDKLYEARNRPLSLEAELRRLVEEKPHYITTLKQILSEYGY